MTHTLYEKYFLLSLEVVFMVRQCFEIHREFNSDQPSHEKFCCIFFYRFCVDEPHMIWMCLWESIEETFLHHPNQFLPIRVTRALPKRSHHFLQCASLYSHFPAIMIPPLFVSHVSVIKLRNILTYLIFLVKNFLRMLLLYKVGKVFLFVLSQWWISFGTLHFIYGVVKILDITREMFSYH